LGVATLQASASDLGVAACAATVKIKITKRGKKKKKKTPHGFKKEEGRVFNFLSPAIFYFYFLVLCCFFDKKNWVYFRFLIVI
jgi:hypothetical protein